MRGKTSHLFLGGEDGWVVRMVGGTRSLVPGVPNSRYFCFFL